MPGVTDVDPKFIYDKVKINELSQYQFIWETLLKKMDAWNLKDGAERLPTNQADIDIRFLKDGKEISVYTNKHEKGSPFMSTIALLSSLQGVIDGMKTTKEYESLTQQGKDDVFKMSLPIALKAAGF